MIQPKSPYLIAKRSVLSIVDGLKHSSIETNKQDEQFYNYTSLPKTRWVSDVDDQYLIIIYVNYI